MTFWKTGVRVKEIVYINIYIYIYYFFEGFSPKSEVENVISSLRHFVINTHFHPNHLLRCQWGWPGW